MASDPTLRTWYRKPFGPRTVISEHPYFRISQPSNNEDGEQNRRRALADLAGV